MRVKNKEIKARRHRKEQKIKEAQRVIRAQYEGKESAKPTPKAAAKPAPKKKKAEA